MGSWNTNTHVHTVTLSHPHRHEEDAAERIKEDESIMTKSIYITVKCYTKKGKEQLCADECVCFTCSLI